MSASCTRSAKTRRRSFSRNSPITPRSTTCVSSPPGCKLARMRRWLLLLALAASTMLHEESRWHLQSNAWVNLHQRLMYEARFGPVPPPAGVAADRWNVLVDRYRTFLGKRHPIFDKELIDLNAALSATRGDKLPAAIPPAAAALLEAAMPLYRTAQWAADDRANRFWISYAEPLLASAGEELVIAHEKAYGRTVPKAVERDTTSGRLQVRGS